MRWWRPWLETSAVVAAALAATTMLFGCSYERIDLRPSNGDQYDGTVLSHYDDVEVVDGGVRLKPGARFAIRTERETQTIAQLEVEVVDGDGMVAYLRTVPHDFDTTHGIAFRYATSGCSIRLDDSTLIPLGYRAERESHTLQLYNEASLTAISVGCDDVFEANVDLPNTEYVILQTLPGSTVILRSVMFFETDQR